MDAIPFRDGSPSTTVTLGWNENAAAAAVATLVAVDVASPPVADTGGSVYIADDAGCSLMTANGAGRP